MTHNYVIHFLFNDYSEKYLGCDRDGILYNDFELCQALMFPSVEKAKEFYDHHGWFGQYEMKAKIKAVTVNDIGADGVLEPKNETKTN